MYKVYIKINNMAFLLPINPDEIKFTYEVSINRYEIIGLGEIAEFSSDKLTSTQINSFIPKINTNLITNSQVNAKDFVNEINEARSVGQVIELIIRRDTLDNIDLNCYINSFNVIEKAGEVGDIYYELQLLQWKPHEAQIVDIQQPAPIHITVPIQTTGSQYIAQVSGMSNTEKKQTTQDSEKVDKNVEVKVGEKVKANTTSELIVGNQVVINGKGYQTPNGIPYTSMGQTTNINFEKTFNNVTGTIDSISKLATYPYRIKFPTQYTTLTYYFKKESLTKKMTGISGGGGTGGGTLR